MVTLWSEGYRATGGESGAQSHGSFDACTLREAVIAYRESVDDKAKRYINIDNGRLDYWGCRFFDNEADARKAFG